MKAEEGEIYGSRLASNYFVNNMCVQYVHISAIFFSFCFSHPIILHSVAMLLFSYTSHSFIYLKLTFEYEYTPIVRLSVPRLFVSPPPVQSYHSWIILTRFVYIFNHPTVILLHSYVSVIYIYFCESINVSATVWFFDFEYDRTSLE